MSAHPERPGARTAAELYAEHHYRDRFRFGEATEDILAMLSAIPAVNRWVDVGSGSQTLLWALALTPGAIVAVDADPLRLQLLHRTAEVATPGPVHTTAAQLCGRGPRDYTDRCRRLTACLPVDCLTGTPPAHPLLPLAGFDLVTQFGLLGLCTNAPQFTATFAAVHQLAGPGAWIAGANWVAAAARDRVQLSAPLYRAAAHQAGITLTVLDRITSADPDFPAVWIYAGTKRST
ncbi:hypothetical protein [Nocardia sp. NPDC003963]